MSAHNFPKVHGFASYSLGVVTLNFEQRELIEDLLDRWLREDFVVIAYQERMKGEAGEIFHQESQECPR